VAVALYRRAAVRRAAVDLYLLQTGKVAAVLGQTDGHPTISSVPQIGDLNTAGK